MLLDLDFEINFLVYTFRIHYAYHFCRIEINARARSEIICKKKINSMSKHEEDTINNFTSLIIIDKKISDEYSVFGEHVLYQEDFVSKYFPKPSSFYVTTIREPFDRLESHLKCFR